MLCHPGETRMEESIRQHLTWKGLTSDIKKKCRTCHTCQIVKRTKSNYGKLPAKEAESIPWDILCTDLIGPYTIRKKGKKYTLWCVTMIDPATSWFELRQIKNKTAINVANVVEQTWLTRYPWPTQIIFDRGTEFMGEFAKMARDDYGLKTKPITTRNPQANAIIERAHQTIGNMIETITTNPNLELDDEDPWSGILSSVQFAMRATVHTTLKASPMQLVFGRDAMFNIPFTANWNDIRKRKQSIINKNNIQENKKRRQYQYSAGDKVLVEARITDKYSEPIWNGPYLVTKVHDNGTLRLQHGVVSETVNIRRIKQYLTK